jgi:hypothetical protein
MRPIFIDRKFSILHAKSHLIAYGLYQRIFCFNQFYINDCLDTG